MEHNFIFAQENAPWEPNIQKHNKDVSIQFTLWDISIGLMLDPVDIVF